MERSAQEAAAFIRHCVELAESGDDALLDIRAHFRERMRARAIFWADVVPVLLEPDRVTTRGLENDDRQQVWLFGIVPAIDEVRIVCSLDWDARLITLNWE